MLWTINPTEIRKWKWSNADLLELIRRLKYRRARLEDKLFKHEGINAKLQHRIRKTTRQIDRWQQLLDDKQTRRMK